MLILINFADDNYRKTQKFNSWSGRKIAKFDKVIEYSPNDIDAGFQEKHKNIFKQKRGYGLWLWKPYLINKTLKELNEGDVLFYCDSGSFFIKDIRKLLVDIENEDIWVSDLPLIEKQFTKKETFILMDCVDEKFINTNQIQATFIAIKKTNKSIEFVNEWLNLCCDIRKLEPGDNHECIDPNTFFISHREDQSILSLLCKKHNIKTHLDPTQYGKLTQKYHQKPFLFRIPRHNDSYKSVIVLHRTRDVNIKVCIKQYLCAILPYSLSKHFVANS